MLFINNLIYKFLLECLKKREIILMDFYFSQLFILDKNKCYVSMLFAALLSLFSRLGHVCIPLDRIFIDKIFSNYILNFLNFFFLKCLSIRKCIDFLFLNKTISSYSENKCTPLILYSNYIYIYKFWFYESYVVNYINSNIKKYVYFDKKKFILINRYLDIFGFDKYQKLAVLNSIISKISIISGGPGTGKTTLIAKLAVIIYRIFGLKYKDSVKVISCTGKSSLCLTGYLNKIYNDLNISNDFRKILPGSCFTIHKFLKFNYFNGSLNFSINNYPHLKVLIIDESSMIDLSTMFYIFYLIKNIKKIIFIGDNNQLGSIEPCSVFNEICNCNSCFSKSFEFKNKIIKEKLSFIDFNKFNLNYLKFINNICFLFKNYRFVKNSLIYKLSILVKLGYVNKIDRFLYDYNFNGDFNFYDANKFNIDFLLNFCINGYKNYIYQVNSNLNIKKWLKIFNLFKIIAVLKDTNFGVLYLNNYINDFFVVNKFVKNIFFDFKNNCYHYYGEPILITKNDSDLELFNGDIGFIIYKKNKINVFFCNKKKYNSFLNLNSLCNWENNWAITVHKSQGSEYEHILIVLPNYYSVLLNRELIYTAITRSKSKISIYAKKEIFLYTIEQKSIIYNNIINKLFIE